MIPVVQRWLRRAPGTEVELARRVRGAANVIFATTGASTRRNLFVDEVSEPFHWVVVEEAGRAWPTELALPLVRGLRWTLVGDHAQIGAYSRVGRAAVPGRARRATRRTTRTSRRCTTRATGTRSTSRPSRASSSRARDARPGAVTCRSSTGWTR